MKLLVDENTHGDIVSSAGTRDVEHKAAKIAKKKMTSGALCADWSVGRIPFSSLPS